MTNREGINNLISQREEARNRGKTKDVEALNMAIRALGARDEIKHLIAVRGGCGLVAIAEAIDVVNRVLGED